MSFDTIEQRIVDGISLTSIRKALRIAMLLALLPLFPALGVAQVSESLSPSLTASGISAPVTTLSPDLLAPQRTFTYDAAGASIFANALSPEVSATVLNSAAQTDTAIRDASQAGQVSPYFQAAGRLGLSFSGEAAQPRASMESALEGTWTGEVAGDGFTSRPPSTAAYNQSGNGVGDTGYTGRETSSWGSPSAADRAGMGRSAGVGRMGLGASYSQGNSSSGEEYREGDELAGADQALEDGATRSSNTGFTGQGQLSKQNLAFGFAARPSPPSPLSSRNATERGIPYGPRTAAYRPVATSLTNRPAILSAPQASGDGEATSQTPTNVFQFSPRSYSSYVFGTTPFSSPNSGDLTFLHPSILRVSPVRLSSFSSQESRERKRRMRWLDANGELTPSLSTTEPTEGLLPEELRTVEPKSGTPLGAGISPPTINPDPLQ